MAASNPNTLRRTALEISVGMVLGFLAATLGGPHWVSLWYRPPSGDAMSCGPSVERALGQFVSLQLILALVGGVVLTLALFLIRRKLKKNKAAPVA